MVYLAWRNLSQNRAQFILGVGGVALALLLMLALDAILAGSEENLAAYINQSGADIFVAQEGVKNMHMAASAITLRDVRLASYHPGVISASPILYTSGAVKIGRAEALSYIIGFDPAEPLGGPRAVVAGTAKVRRDEAIIDRAVARGYRLRLGDKVEILGKTFTVVGMTEGLTNIVNSVVFIRLKDFQELQSGQTASYALLKVKPGYDPASVAAAIAARNGKVSALTGADFSHEERRIVRDMSVEVLNIMNLSGLLIGLAVTALTLYTNTLGKRREFGVLKAMGAQNRHLYAVVIVQACVSLAIGSGAAIGLIRLMGLILPLAAPGVALALTKTGVAQVVLASLLIGVLAALAPAWQIAQLDPARVFRG